jgi:hypothetical protein
VPRPPAFACPPARLPACLLDYHMLVDLKSMAGWLSVHFSCTPVLPIAATPPHRYPRLPCPAAAAPAPAAAAAAAPILGGGGSGEEGPGKPLLGKNPHSEGIRTKRDLQHDHHLNRKGKGGPRRARKLSRHDLSGMGVTGRGGSGSGSGMGGPRQTVWV